MGLHPQFICDVDAINGSRKPTHSFVSYGTMSCDMFSNAQCTPTECENRRSSVDVYQTPTRSSGLIGVIPPIRNLNRRKSQSALVGRCVPNVNPIVGANRQVYIEFRLDSTVGGKLTNHSYHFRARLDLTAIFASTGIDYFTHFRHFCFVVSIQTRLKHHSTSFQMQKPPLATYIIAFYGSMQTFTLITQRSLFLGFE